MEESCNGCPARLVLAVVQVTVAYPRRAAAPQRQRSAQLGCLVAHPQRQAGIRGLTVFIVSEGDKSRSSRSIDAGAPAGTSAVPEPDKRLEIVFSEALRALAHQQSLLDNLRSRATLLTTAAALVVSFPGVAAVTGQLRLGFSAVLAAGSLAGVLICSLVVCAPWWRWRFGLAPPGCWGPWMAAMISIRCGGIWRVTLRTGLTTTTGRSGVCSGGLPRVCFCCRSRWRLGWCNSVPR